MLGVSIALSVSVPKAQDAEGLCGKSYVYLLAIE